MRDVFIAGVGLTKWGRYDGRKGRPLKEGEELGAEAVLNALEDADMQWTDIQSAFCGHVYGGSAFGERIAYRVGMTALPITNVENACSSSTSALMLAYQQVASGIYDVVLAIGCETIPPGFLDNVGVPVWQKYMGLDVLPAKYAMETTRYMKEYSVTPEDIARITVLARKNGTLNPNAMFQQEVTVEEVLDSRMICVPLTLLMVCANADGASAAIVCSRERLKSKSEPVSIDAIVNATSNYGTGEEGGGSVKIKNPNCSQVSSKQAYEISGFGPEDIDVVQGYDTMSPALMWNMEDLGFCKPGEFIPRLKEGVFNLDGKIPLNTDGGIMSRGHPVGATGVAQITELYYQLRGQAGARQVKGVRTGLAHAMGVGGISMVAILKR